MARCFPETVICLQRTVGGGRTVSVVLTVDWTNQRYLSYFSLSCCKLTNKLHVNICCILSWWPSNLSGIQHPTIGLFTDTLLCFLQVSCDDKRHGLSWREHTATLCPQPVPLVARRIFQRSCVKARFRVRVTGWDMGCACCVP